MIKLYVSVLAVMACLASFAQTTLTATNSGNFHVGNNWNPKQVPADGNTLIIPQGFTITVANATSISNINLVVNGTLTVNGDLSLTGTSWSVTVNSGGQINGTGTMTGTKSTSGTATIYSGTTVTGPTSATYGESPVFTPLPVKFTGFSVSRQNSDVLVQWSTSEEVNAENYYVERSYDGANWANIATVASQGNTSSLTHYSHLDKHVTAAIAYYRIKQVDLDGQYAYTAIRSVKSAGGALAVNVAAINNRVVLQFSAPVKGSVEVRLVSLAGQVVSKQIISNPVGQVVLNNSALKGSYIVTVSNAADINVAKQVVL